MNQSLWRPSLHPSLSSSLSFFRPSSLPISFIYVLLSYFTVSLSSPVFRYFLFLIFRYFFPRFRYVYRYLLFPFFIFPLSFLLHILSFFFDFAEIFKWKLRSIHHPVESSSMVYITVRSQAPRCTSPHGVKLHSVHHPTESSSTVYITPRSQVLQICIFITPHSQSSAVCILLL